MRSSLAATATALLGVATVMPAQAIDIQDFDLIQRERYLADMGDCGACHTLRGSGALLAGGRPLETFGTLLAPNITPDPETGIGAWTDDEFVNSLTKGTGRNGTHLYPAMPYTYMTKITSEDALAIRAYLNTIPAMRNSVQPNQLEHLTKRLNRLRIHMTARIRFNIPTGTKGPVMNGEALFR
jgi:mono/diheme cytochrome c family protein